MTGEIITPIESTEINGQINVDPVILTFLSNGGFVSVIRDTTLSVDYPLPNPNSRTWFIDAEVEVWEEIESNVDFYILWNE